MIDLVREQTEQSPEINFKTNGDLLIRGISVLENIHSFYTDIFDWLEEFEHTLPSAINLIFDLEYVNTSSTKSCVEIARKVDSYRAKCPNINITWRYKEGDDDAYELGKDIEYWVKIKFNYEVYS
jgi:hypothetical protein